MKDTTVVNNNNNNNYNLKNKIFKDVVIIGNGPSGITLSYMLSGHWPYWIKEKVHKHPDELLRARLNHADYKKSLVLQDLHMLADGLEGRSSNPVSLLLDSLQNPCADIGLNLPSMLDYKYHPEKEIDHVVIGKGPPGGAWHRMDPNLRTLSLSAWMSLPGLDFNSWEESNPPKSNNQNEKTNSPSCIKCTELRKNNLLCQNNYSNNNNNESEIGALCCKCSNLKKLNGEVEIKSQNKNEDQNITIIKKSIPPRRNLSLKRANSKEVQTRALISRVAEYYENYVTIMGLEKYFQSHSIVTSVMPINNNDCITNNSNEKNARWIVCGFNRITNKSFSYICKDVVLANGSSDFANRLGTKGESLSTPWIKYELPHLELALEQLSDEQKLKLKPVVIVGAGLSAADAVTICRSSNINVVHVFRNRTAGLDKMLPENVYPEYHEVHKMMQNNTAPYDFYTPFPEHTISDISNTPTSSGGHLVTLQHLRTGEITEMEISYCVILIGSRPDLRFISNVIQQKCDINQSIDIHSNNNNESFMESPKWNKRISWLKTLCAKCKHINLCERTRRNDYKKICGHNNKTNEIACKNEINSTKIEELSSGYGLGENPEKPIDCKTNPISVNKYTNRINNTPKGLYAMGPLVSDNFIRFIPGGALAITSALHKEND